MFGHQSYTASESLASENDIRDEIPTIASSVPHRILDSRLSLLRAAYFLHHRQYYSALPVVYKNRIKFICKTRPISSISVTYILHVYGHSTTPLGGAENTQTHTHTIIIIEVKWVYIE